MTVPVDNLTSVAELTSLFLINKKTRIQPNRSATHLQQRRLRDFSNLDGTTYGPYLATRGTRNQKGGRHTHTRGESVLSYLWCVVCEREWRVMSLSVLSP